MKRRTIKSVFTAPEIMMGSNKLKQPLPVAGLNQVDPFLLLHHMPPTKHEPGVNALDVGPHPHRGFEPVTFVCEGEVEHNDSLGNHSVIAAGGVQWMTAGRGIVHSEGASKAQINRGGSFEMIQLWINLPKDKKMTTPIYQGVQKEAIPSVEAGDGKAKVNVVSGTYQGRKGPVDSLTGIEAYTLEMSEGGQLTFDVPAARNVMIYQLRGNTTVNQHQVTDTQLVHFENDDERVEIIADTDALILFLTGDPIEEPMAQYGPYVMNTQSEILEAMRDYEQGKMGVLTHY
jgi:redox-sensitive bicupin YhaK (pirin superfamily)